MSPLRLSTWVSSNSTTLCSAKARQTGTLFSMRKTGGPEAPGPREALRAKSMEEMQKWGQAIEDAVDDAKAAAEKV